MVGSTPIRFRHPPSITSQDANSYKIPRDDAGLEKRYNTMKYDGIRRGTVTGTVTAESAQMDKKSVGKTSRHPEQTAPSPFGSRTISKRRRRAVAKNLQPHFPEVRQKDGHLEVTLTIPVHLPGEVTSCQMTLRISHEDLLNLWYADRHKLGKELARQCYYAALIRDMQQEPHSLAPLQRRRSDAMAKRVASLLAKPIHAFIKAQMCAPDTQIPEFRRALQVIIDTYNHAPRAVDITAWFVEQYLWNQWGEIWGNTGLRRPTANPDRFARDCLYTSPHVSANPEEIQFGAKIVTMIVQGLPS